MSSSNNMPFSIEVYANERRVGVKYEYIWRGKLSERRKKNWNSNNQYTNVFFAIHTMFYLLKHFWSAC